MLFRSSAMFENGSEDDGCRFEDVLKQAALMKESRDAVFRRKYDFWPSFYQHSLFSKDVRNRSNMLADFLNIVNFDFF